MRPSIRVAIAGLLCFSAYVSAQPNKQSYKLQERCGKHAAEVPYRIPKTDRYEANTVGPRVNGGNF
jgi:hypothetical protein